MKKALIKEFVFVLLLIALPLFGCTFNETISTAKFEVKIIDTVNNKEEIKTFDSAIIRIGDLEKIEKDGFIFLGYANKINGTPYKDEDFVSIRTNNTLYLIFERIQKDNPFFINEVASVYLYADEEINSKLNYVTGSVSIKGKNYQLDNVPASLRLRGNSSLDAPKKSYKIKFDKKQDVFGFGSDKEWALIANYYDPSMLRNYYAYKFAQAMNMPYAVDCIFVELYLNDECQGLYLFCETVKTGTNRINIEVDDETIIDLPFLLELDFKMTSVGDPDSNGVLNVDYFELDLNRTAHKIYPIGCKYPKAFDKITEEQFESIKARVYTAFNSVEYGTYENYFNVDSLIDFYLIQELMMNIDLDHSSVFFYQALNEKICFGPVWDFDISSGNCNYVNNYTPFVLMKNVNGGSYLFNRLLTYDKFKNSFLERLTYVKNNIMPLFSDSFQHNYQMLMNYQLRDNNIWHNLFEEFWPKPDYLVGPTYYQQLMFLQSYIEQHLNAMSDLIK